MLLSKEYATERRKEITLDRAARVYRPAGAPAGRGDTVYLTAADDRGNAISLIQSLFESFGAGIVAHVGLADPVCRSVRTSLL